MAFEIRRFETLNDAKIGLLDSSFHIFFISKENTNWHGFNQKNIL